MPVRAVPANFGVIKRLYLLCCREIKQLAADPRLLTIILLMPVFYAVLFGTLYQPRRVTKIAAWVIDEDHSPLSRAIRNAVANSETFALVREDGTLGEFHRATQQGDAFACLWIPKSFERDVKHGRPVRLLTLIDGSNMLIANSVLRGATEIGGTYSVGVQMKRLTMRGTPSDYALSAAIPIESATRVWYNPAFNYLDFLLPGLIAAIIQQVTLLAVALAFAREQEQRLVPELLAISSSPLEVLTVKGVVFTLINFLVAAGTFVVTFRFYNITVTGSLPLFLLLLAIFIISLVGMGLLVSVLAKDQLFATQVLMLIAVPSFLLSGFTWPQMSMIPVIRLLSNCLPLTHFVLAMRAIIVQDADITIIRPHLLWLWSLAAICYCLAYLAIWHVLARARRYGGAREYPAGELPARGCTG